MGQNRFLFEFSSKTIAEHVLKGEWFWKMHKVHLQWWNPTVGSIPSNEKLNHVWIRLVGLPIQFWSHKVFKEVGDHCGGWLQTEEETELRNHLKWARIKVRGDGESVPKSVKVGFEGIIYQIQVWCEAPVRTFVGEGGGEMTSNNRVVEDDYASKRGALAKDVIWHVGFSTAVEIQVVPQIGILESTHKRKAQEFVPLQK